MRINILVIAAFLVSCQQKKTEQITPSQERQTTVEKTAEPSETIAASYIPEETTPLVKAEEEKPEVFSNKRFRNVTVSKNAVGDYVIKGEGQIFEANFGWVIEDGHKELKQGYAMTDAGAPEWGSFKFTVPYINKIKADTKLHMVLFESSAKDGSRKYELPVPLPE